MPLDGADEVLGIILKWDGTTWTAMVSGSSDYLRGVWGSDSKNIWAVGDTGAILKCEGSASVTRPRSFRAGRGGPERSAAKGQGRAGPGRNAAEPRLWERTLSS